MCFHKKPNVSVFICDNLLCRFVLIYIWKDVFCATCYDTVNDTGRVKKRVFNERDILILVIGTLSAYCCKLCFVLKYLLVYIYGRILPWTPTREWQLNWINVLPCYSTILNMTKMLLIRDEYIPSVMLHSGLCYIFKYRNSTWKIMEYWAVLGMYLLFIL